MDIFHALTMLGGLCLFLFGMNFMGQALERRAGGKLRTLLDKMTGSVGAGFLTGIIQSSSATTVMVVGFVNSGLMTLRQAINVIMGANVGTTVTAWLLSLAGIDGGSVWLQLLKPTAFTPVLALIGIIFYMFCKDSRKKETGSILLGFATLMFGMDTMSAAVAGLKDVPGFAELFLAFTNPLLGVLVGAVLTAIIQSSSASVGLYRPGQLRRRGAHYHGPEHRYLRHGADLLRRHQQKRQAGGRGASDVQCDRRGGAADGVLHRQGHLCPGTAEQGGVYGGYRCGPFGVQYPVYGHTAALRRPAGEVGYPPGAG